MTAFLLALVPSAGVLFIFWIGIRALIEADRRERSAQARIEALEQQQNPRGAQPVIDPMHSGVEPPV